MVLSRGSVALVMRIRLVSVVGEFLWSGERPVDNDFSAFLVVIDIHQACCSEFAVTVIMPAIYIDLASH